MIITPSVLRELLQRLLGSASYRIVCHLSLVFHILINNPSKNVKYDSKTVSITITEAENRFGRVEIVETGLKMASRGAIQVAAASR